MGHPSSVVRSLPGSRRASVPAPRVPWHAVVREAGRSLLRRAYGAVTALAGGHAVRSYASDLRPPAGSRDRSRVCMRSPPDLGYDPETTQWARRLLEGGDPAHPFPPEDPTESMADAARLRGVLPYLCELHPFLAPDVIESRLTRLLRGLDDASSVPRCAVWDTTNTALRVLGLFEGAEYLPGGRASRTSSLASCRSGTSSATDRSWRSADGSSRQETTGWSTRWRAWPSTGCSTAAGVPTRRRGMFCAPRSPRSSSPTVDTSNAAPTTTCRCSRPCGPCSTIASAGALGRDRSRRPTPNGAAALRGMSFGSRPAPFGDISRLWSGRTVDAEMQRALGDPVSRHGRSFLPESGIAALRWNTVGGHVAELPMYVGPLGLDENPGHAHDDFRRLPRGRPRGVGGPPDGCYRYAGDPESTWFKLARAHNVVRHEEDASRHPRRFYRWPRAVRLGTDRASFPQRSELAGGAAPKACGIGSHRSGPQGGLGPGRPGCWCRTAW